MGRAPLGMIMTLILMIMMTLVEMTAMMKGLVKSKGVTMLSTLGITDGDAQFGKPHKNSDW